MSSHAEQLIGYGLIELYRLREIAENTCNLLNRPERAFVSEELMPIPEDTKLPPDYIQEW